MAWQATKTSKSDYSTLRLVSAYVNVLEVAL